jgi:hypothetical protein
MSVRTVSVTVDIPEEWAANLEALVDERSGVVADLAGVLSELADHAQQGVYRSGAWEREWLCKVFGYDWLARLEPDPDPEWAAMGWERPRGARP